MHIDPEDTFSGRLQYLDWNAARLAKEGEEYCGDQFLVKEAGDKILAAVIDGVGHGKKAKEAALIARDTLKSHPIDSLIGLVKLCHETLKSTRGVVMSLAMFDCVNDTISWISVGNVDGVLIMADSEKKNKNIVLRGGIVGYKLPALQASIFPVSPGDLLILTTDGVKNEYINHISHEDSTEKIVDFISTSYFNLNDDALILAARYKKSN